MAALGLIGYIIKIQFDVIKMISEFETKNLNPLDADKNLARTRLPTLYAFGGILIAILLNFYTLWPVFFIELGAGAVFYRYVTDFKSWFEPRFLFRDLSKIKLRHSILLVASCFCGLLTFIIWMLK